MDNLLTKVVPVVIENVCVQWHKEEVAKIFGLMCQLKMKGYGTKYPEGVLPIDTTDFICSHILTCLQTEQGLVPIMGHKTTELSLCRLYNVEFPGLSLVKRAGGQEHVHAVEQLIEFTKGLGATLAYSGSWTIDPTVPWNKEEKTLLRDLFEATYTAYHLDRKFSRSMLGGTLRFKTEQIFYRMGYRPLELKGNVLPHINVSHLQGEPVVVMTAEQFSLEAHQKVKKFQDWWGQRKIFNGDVQRPSVDRSAA